MSSEKESESRKWSSEEISREFKTLVNSGDLHSLSHMQHTILGRLQDSNAVLSHFNDFSQNCIAEISGDIARHTRVLKSVKSDLDYIFQKLRSMKSKIMATYPDAFPEDSTGEVIDDRRPDLEMPK
ncbi:kxDL motif-containing protein 1 [Vigna unguiculata]|uniref:kxDL motif-containing protein 1 n=1 Tax=Vigna unguiculata TaxID=3917 RepID=UPI001016327A|nr:kxDL motif-containing protein 1 [Vigna unguiculata]